MIGVGCAPPSRAASRQAAWSSSREAHATWWTVPAPCRPRSAGAGSYVYARAALLAGEHGVRVEAEPVEQRPRAVGVERVRAHAVEALQRMLGRDVGRVGDQRRVGHVAT